MVDPAVQEMIRKLWWVLPLTLTIGIVQILLNKKINEYKRKKRIQARNKHK